MVDVDKFSDAELRTKLLEFGFPVMPITGTTRKVMAKKLKMLMENKNKLNSEGGRRSLGRYSSEEESDSEVKASKKKDNRRATMAAPIMQPPSSNVKIRKSIRLNDTPEPEIVSPREVRSTTTTTTTTRTQKILKSAQDDFDTGSESESDIVSNNYRSSNIGLGGAYDRGSPVKTNYSPIKSTLTSSYSGGGVDSAGDRYSPQRTDLSYGTSKSSSFNANSSTGRFSSYNSPSVASDYAADRLNQIRSRLSLNSPSYEKSTYSSSNTVEKEETPFLSNFTKRLSALSSDKKTDDYKNDVIKEHDTNGASSYVRSSLTSFRAGKGREGIYDYRSNQKSVVKNNLVSFAVLASAALFFVFLAIMYLGMKPDTAVIPSGKLDKPNPYSSG